MLLIAPVLGSSAGLAPVAVASPVPQVGAAASFSDGRCTSGDTSSVTVVIDFQELGGSTVVRCAHGLQAGANGIAAMRAAGIAFDGNARFGSTFVCRILGRPSASESLPVNGGGYHEQCVNTSPAKAYWSYWQASENGSWAYSTLGIASSRARLGGFEGWSFSLNNTDDTNPSPRVDTTLAAPAPPTTTAPAPTTRPAPPATTPPMTARPTTPRVTTALPTPALTSTARTSTARPTTARATTSRTTIPRPTTRVTTPPRATGDPGATPTAPRPTPDTSTAGADPTTTTAAPPPDDPTGTDAPPRVTSSPAPGTRASPTSGGSATAAPSPSPSPSPSPNRGVPSGSATDSGSPSDSTSVSRPTADSGAGVPSSGGVQPATGSGGVSGTTPAVSGTGGPATDPDLAATRTAPESSSPWPVIGVLALALIAGGAAFVIARRRRGDGA